MANNYQVPSLSVPDLSPIELGPGYLGPSQVIKPISIGPNAANASVRQRAVREHVRDLGDIILGNPFIGTRQLQNTLDDAGLSFLKPIPVANWIAGATVMLDERFLEPMISGRPEIAIVNTLETVSSSMDILSNIVKSLFPGTGGGSLQDFVDSMGLDSSRYRKRYQWDTGNFILDTVLEWASDPINWITLGAEGVAQSSGKSMADSLEETIINRVGRETYEAYGGRKLVNMATRLMKLDVNSDEYSVLLGKIKAQLDSNELIRKLVENAPKNTSSYDNLNALVKNFKDLKVDDLLQDISNLRTSHWYEVYMKANRVKDIAKGIDKRIFETALSISTPYGVMKPLIDQIRSRHPIKLLFNKMYAALEKVTPKDAFGQIDASAKLIDAELDAMHVSMFQNIYKRFKEIPELMDVNPKEFTAIYRQCAESVTRLRMTDDYEKIVARKFIKAIREKYPVLKSASEQDLLDLAGASSIMLMKDMELERSVTFKKMQKIQEMKVDKQAFKEFLNEQLLENIIPKSVPRGANLNETLDNLVQYVEDLNQQKGMTRRRAVEKQADDLNRYITIKTKEALKVTEDYLNGRIELFFFKLEEALNALEKTGEISDAEKAIRRKLIQYRNSTGVKREQRFKELVRSIFGPNNKDASNDLRDMIFNATGDYDKFTGSSQYEAYKFIWQDSDESVRNRIIPFLKINNQGANSFTRLARSIREDLAAFEELHKVIDSGNYSPIEMYNRVKENKVINRYIDFINMGREDAKMSPFKFLRFDANDLHVVYDEAGKPVRIRPIDPDDLEGKFRALDKIGSLIGADPRYQKTSWFKSRVKTLKVALGLVEDGKPTIYAKAMDIVGDVATSTGPLYDQQADALQDIFRHFNATHSEFGIYFTEGTTKPAKYNKKILSEIFKDRTPDEVNQRFENVDYAKLKTLGQPYLTEEEIKTELTSAARNLDKITSDFFDVLEGTIYEVDSGIVYHLDVAVSAGVLNYEQVEKFKKNFAMIQEVHEKLVKGEFQNLDLDTLSMYGDTIDLMRKDLGNFITTITKYVKESGVHEFDGQKIIFTGFEFPEGYTTKELFLELAKDQDFFDNYNLYSKEELAAKGLDVEHGLPKKKMENIAPVQMPTNFDSLINQLRDVYQTLKQENLTKANASFQIIIDKVNRYYEANLNRRQIFELTRSYLWGDANNTPLLQQLSDPHSNMTKTLYSIAQQFLDAFRVGGGDEQFYYQWANDISSIAMEVQQINNIHYITVDLVNELLSDLPEELRLYVTNAIFNEIYFYRESMAGNLQDLKATMLDNIMRGYDRNMKTYVIGTILGHPEHVVSTIKELDAVDNISTAIYSAEGAPIIDAYWEHYTRIQNTVRTALDALHEGTKQIISEANGIDMRLYRAFDSGFLRNINTITMELGDMISKLHINFNGQIIVQPENVQEAFIQYIMKLSGHEIRLDDPILRSAAGKQGMNMFNIDRLSDEEKNTILGALMNRGSKVDTSKYGEATIKLLERNIQFINRESLAYSVSRVLTYVGEIDEYNKVAKYTKEEMEGLRKVSKEVASYITNQQLNHILDNTLFQKHAYNAAMVAGIGTRLIHDPEFMADYNINETTFNLLYDTAEEKAQKEAGQLSLDLDLGIARNIDDAMVLQEFIDDLRAADKALEPEYKRLELFKDRADENFLYQDVDEKYGDMASIKGMDWDGRKRPLSGKPNVSSLEMEIPVEDEKELPAMIRRLSDTREALIEVYSHSDVVWAPRNAREYFMSLKPHQIYAWDIVTSNGFQKDGLSRSLTTNYLEIKRSRGMYSTVEKLRNTIDPMFPYYTYKTIREFNGQVTDEMINDIILRAPSNSTSYIINLMDDGINTLVKDKNDLFIWEDTIVDSIKNDSQSLKQLMPVAELENDTRTVREAIGVKTLDKHGKLLGRFGINGKTKMNSVEVRTYIAYERQLTLYRNLIRMDAEQIRGYIDNIAQSDFIVIQSQTDKFPFLKLNKEDIKKAGLKIERIKTTATTQPIFIIRKTDNTIHSFNYQWWVPEYAFEEAQQKIDNAINTVRRYYDNKTTLPTRLLMGDYINHDTYMKYLDNEKLAKFFGDEEIRNSYLNLDKNGRSNFFNKRQYNPDMMMIGPNAHNNFISAIFDEAADPNVTYMYKPVTADRLVVNNGINIIKHSDAKNKYLQFLFNAEFSSDAQMFHNALDNLTDEELDSFFKQNAWTGAILRKNKRGELRVYQYHIFSQQTLKEAREAGAVIIPREAFRNAVISINEDKITSPIVRFITRVMHGMFKTMYLSTAGFLMRNGLDTLIVKNATSTEDDLFGVIDNMKYEVKALRMIHLYDKIVRAELDVTQETLNKNILRNMLSKLSPEEQRLFRLTSLFLTSSASSGFSPELQEALLRINLKDMIYDGTAFEQFWQEKILPNLMASKYINKINSYIEMTGRLGLFYKLTEKGYGIQEAVREVVKTHFDYDFMSNKLGMFQELVWFSTFPLMNALYYINDGYIRNMPLLKLQLDMLEQSWNSGDYTWDRVKNNDYLRYNALAGNLRIYWNHQQNNIILKTGSSALDAMNVLMNPAGEFLDRLNPFVSVLFGLEGPEELNPMNGLVNRLKTMQSGKSMAPSIYTWLNNYTPKKGQRNYGAKNYSNVRYKRPKRTYIRPYYNYSYGKRYVRHGVSYRKYPRYNGPIATINSKAIMRGLWNRRPARFRHKHLFSRYNPRI